jgi:hypothetical protein
VTPSPVLGRGAHSLARKDFWRVPIPTRGHTLSCSLNIRILWLQGTAIPTADMAATAVPPAGAPAAAVLAAGPAAKCAADPPGADPGVGGAAGAGLTKQPAQRLFPLPNPPPHILSCSVVFIYYCPGTRTLYIYCVIGYPKLFLFLHLGNKWF